MAAQTLTIFTYSADERRFVKKTTQRAVGAREILIKTTHSGLCYTDVHAKGKGCGLGHEGVGHVEKVGSAVLGIKAGDRVGWGWLHSSCGHCTTCLSGYRQYCAEARGFAYSELEQGAFGDYRVIDAEFAYPIPDEISSVDAGPLMCAGASVYEALHAAQTRPHDRVGVVGVGGLGHMAVLFARAMGCGVTALLASSQQEDGAQKLGGDIVRAPPQAGPEWCKPVDVLLVTSNVLPNWDSILPLLNRMARIVLMTIQEQPLSIPYMPFILPGHRIISSTEASRRNHIDMLNFAAQNRIKPWVERFPMTEEGLEQAFSKIENGQMRYRGVLEW
ncbi:GroES-like protein [Cryphonectria parasitica EP155]|uniref:GroES-like protein n=1 Tax=Cryphonectria parasitica (strain ATCC 38755 / EP155) TaxID=660469 RepID=A0A9P5CKD0_CRYP1|nr:GroES-like protein [Cryphonectria parasitica EP155]KAF3761072.1 GroES-like protein [Cryphonectria parasitica EP155]